MLGKLFFSLCPLLFLAGCASIKKAGLVGASALGVGAIVGSVTGTAPAILASAGSATITTAIVDLSTPKGESIMGCESPTFFSALETLITVTGWGALGFFALPMLISWLTPSPLERKKRSP